MAVSDSSCHARNVGYDDRQIRERSEEASSCHARNVGFNDCRIRERSEEASSCHARNVGYDYRRIRERREEVEHYSSHRRRNSKAFGSVQSPQLRDRGGRLLAPPRVRRFRSPSPRAREQRKRSSLPANISRDRRASVASAVQDMINDSKPQTEKPFAGWIMESPPEPTLKLHKFGKFYAWKSNAWEHVLSFEARMRICCNREAIWCRAFLCTFDVKALRWFCNLAPESVTSWRELKNLFMAEFGWLDESDLSAMCNRD